MNTAGRNIFDMMLGGTPAVNATVAGVSNPESAATMPLFGAVLGDLLQPADPTLVPEQTNIITESNPMPDFLLNLVDAKAALDTGSGSAVESSEIELIGGNGNLLIEAAGLNTNRIVDDESITKIETGSSISMVEMPARFVRMFNEKPVDLEPGRYQVASQKLDNSQLSLTLLSEETGEEIRLTLPADALVNLSRENVKKINPNRVQVQLPGKSANDVSRLFEQLNLRQIEIGKVTNDNADMDAAAEPSIKARTESKPVEIALIGEQSRNAVVIRSKLQVRDIRAMRKTDAAPVELSKNEKIGSDDFSVESRITDRTGLATRTIENKVANDRNGLNQNSFAAQVTKAIKPADASLSKELADFVVSNSNRFDTQFSEVKERTVQPVRFTLPDDIRTALQPNGKSVTIAIEPEHLGHAKLNLIMNENGLRARVVVESVEAKLMVEKSLDQLNNQLSRADVKVDSIEVNVGHRGDGRQQFQQPSQQNRWSSNRINEFLNNLNDDSTSTVSNGAVQRRQLVTRMTVDVVA